MKRKILAGMLVAAMLTTGFGQTEAPVSAKNVTSMSGREVSEDIAAETTTYLFGADAGETAGIQYVSADSRYTKETGMGFSKVEYPTDAAGWDGGGSGKGVYHPRDVVAVEGDASYVSASEGALAISSRVWTEKESTGYGVYTYEETSTFDIDCASADYEITVKFVNPTSAAYTAYIAAENIARGYQYNKEDNGNQTAVTNVTVEAGAAQEITINACVYDGQLNLGFLAASSAATRAAAKKQTVYVSKVTVKRKATETSGEKPTVYLVSDSTVQAYDDVYAPQTGWGETLCEYFGAEDYKQTAQTAPNSIRHESRVYDLDRVIIEDRALGGRSSASFIKEGLLDDVLEDIKPGDYLFIQFGHNDATPSRPNRYVSSEDFGDWIQVYIDGAIQRGAQPVLVTPVARYDYSVKADGKLKSFNSGFAKYGAVMKKIAAEQNIPLIDLTSRSIEVCNRYGIEGSKKLFLHVNKGEYEGNYSGGVTDNTHLQVLGATEFAKCVAQGIKASEHAGLSKLKLLLDNTKMPPEAPAVRCTSPSADTAELQKYITLAWDAVDGASSYIVYRRSDKSDIYEQIGTTESVSYKDESDGIATNINHYYKVAAVNNNGVGELSDACETPIAGTLIQSSRESYTDRALTGIDLSGTTGAQTLVSAVDADGKEYTSGVYLSWRSFEADYDAEGNLTTAFDVFRGSTKIAEGIHVTNLIDPAGSASDTYTVVGNNDSAIGVSAKEISPWTKRYLELNLYAPPDETVPLYTDSQGNKYPTTCTYSANDMSVGDIDGDGVLELIVKWYPSNAQDNSKPGYTGKTFIDTYKVDTSAGTAELVTRIDMGINIRSGAHYTQFQVWDFDNDGKAEIAVKTSDGTTTYKSADGTDKKLTKVAHVGAVDADALPVETLQTEEQYDYRNKEGHVIVGKEYFSIFNLDDGTKVADEVAYTPERGPVSDMHNIWGNGSKDNSGNRSERYLSGVAYLDGENPYAVFCRGYYHRMTLTAYYYDKAAGEIKIYWAFDTDKAGSQYMAQGNHGLSVNDVDGDGKDEIIYGSLVVDHDGEVLHNTGLGHGDAMHVSDWVPWNDGLEIMSVHEEPDAKLHVEVRDAATGEILMGYYVGRDTGRGAAGDIDPTAAGAEWWAIAGANNTLSNNPSWNSNSGCVYSSLSTMEELVELANSNPPANFTLFWDGDLLTEIQDHTFDETPYLPIGVNLLKWDYENNQTETLLYSEEFWSNNGTKGNVCLAADILGDWREEIIVRTADTADVTNNHKIRIYMTTIQTDYVVPCLLENLAYREGIAWQNVGYNQPANTDYLLSEGVITAQLTAIDCNEKKTEIRFTEANDGKYGHDIVGYHIYRADVGADGKAGDYTLIDTLGGYVPDAEDNLKEYVYTDTNVDYNKSYSYKIAAIVEAEGVVAGTNGTAGKTVTRESYMSRPVVASTPIEIVSVSTITLESIVQDTPCESVADLLPKTVRVTDQAGQEQDAKVVWDVSKVDITKANTYEVTAKVQGYADEIPVSLLITPNGVANQSIKETDIVLNKADVMDALPSTMTLTFLNGVKADVTISWDKESVGAVDTSTADTSFTVNGTWKNDSVNLTDRSISIKVNIVTNFIVTLGDIYTEVDLGTTDIAAALPETVTAVYENGETKTVPVIWTTSDIEKIDTSVSGTYEVEYTASDYTGSKKAQVVVLYPTLYKFDFGISSSKTESGWIPITVNKKKGTTKVKDFGMEYSDEKGYGFLDGDAVIEGRDEKYTFGDSYSANIYQDFAMPQNQTFAVKVPNGRYQVVIMAGSQDKSANTVTGIIEGTVEVNLRSTQNTYTIGTYEVDVKDGRLDFKWTNANCRTNMMIIRQISVTGDSGNSESSETQNSEADSGASESSETQSSEEPSESSETQSSEEPSESSEKPGDHLTEEQKKQVNKITDQLGVSEETAIKIQSVGEQYKVPEDTLLISDKTITGQKSDADIKGSSFALLQARAVKITKNQIQLKWTKVKGADGYLIYGNKCGKANKLKLLKTIKKGSATSYTQKKLNKGTFYKYIVRAYKVVDGQKVTLAASKTIHIVTKGGKNVNERSVNVNKTKVSLKKGKSFTIKASAVKGPKKPHRKIAYESTNPKVAKVSAKGKITAVGKGKCTVYVYSQSGLFKKITVTVK